MIRSDSPPAYASALSKKFTPLSHAAAMQSRARPVSSCAPNDTHEPNDNTLTLRPDRPSLRYSMSIRRLSLIPLIVCRPAGGRAYRCHMFEWSEEHLMIRDAVRQFVE